VQVKVEIAASALALMLAVVVHTSKAPHIWQNNVSLLFLSVNIFRATTACTILFTSYPRLLFVGRRDLFLFQGCIISIVVTVSYVWHVRLLLLVFANSMSHDFAEVSFSQRLSEVAVAAASTFYSCMWWFACCGALDRRAARASAVLSHAKPEVTRFQLELGNAAQLTSCVICLADFEEECEVGKLPCGHVFHDECIQLWLLKGHEFARCPMRCKVSDKQDSCPHPAEEDRGMDGMAMDALQVQV
jgi:hypothetical protein